MAAQKLSPEAQRIEDFFNRRDTRSADAWIPEEGAWFIGTVTDMSIRTGGDYGDYLRVVYKVSKSSDNRDVDSLVAVHVFHMLLKDQLEELKTKIGSVQIVSYLGQKTRRNPTQEQIEKGRDKYHDYYVENWSYDEPVQSAH